MPGVRLRPEVREAANALGLTEADIAAAIQAHFSWEEEDSRIGLIRIMGRVAGRRIGVVFWAQGDHFNVERLWEVVP